MSWDSVPWFVDKGALVSAETARLLAYAAFGGAEGVVGIGDLKVAPLDVPGPQVQVLPGACSITNRATASDYQAYAGRLPTAETVDIAATGSGGGRSDLIVARVEDPWLAGEPWPDPADPTTGPYIFTRVLSNVPAGTKTVAELNLGFSAIALARVDLPASTATVTADMITDLRQMVAPRRERRIYVASPAGNGTVPTPDNTWYALGGIQHNVPVPAWANYATVVSTVSGIYLQNAKSDFYLRNAITGGSNTVVGQPTSFDNNVPISSGGDPGTIPACMTADQLAIPAALRGTTVSVFTQIEVWSRGSGGVISTTTTTTGVLDIEFSEAPE